MSEEQLAATADAQGPPEYKDWRKSLEDGLLLGTRCGSCEWTTATPKRRCMECGSENLHRTELPTTGTVYSETTINVTPSAFDEPYQIVIVDLGETFLTARIDGAVEIGNSVRFSDVIRTDNRPAPVFEGTE